MGSGDNTDTGRENTEEKKGLSGDKEESKKENKEEKEKESKKKNSKEKNGEGKEEKNKEKAIEKKSEENKEEHKETGDMPSGKKASDASSKSHSGILTFFRSLTVAFSIYSKIPMPRFTWGSEDMACHLAFFPLVGAVIGGLCLLWEKVCAIAGFGSLPFSLIAVSIPLLVTGGFHFDGYMDTMDAIHSYKGREEKLRIMDDPHVGAFAITFAMLWCLIDLAAWSTIENTPALKSACAGFILSRAFSGFGVVTIPSAKKGGMLKTQKSTAGKKVVKSALTAEIIVIGILMVVTSPLSGSLVFLSCLITYLCYRAWSIRTFSGITGDLAGWFVTVSELVMALAAGAAAAIMAAG